MVPLDSGPGRTPPGPAAAPADEFDRALASLTGSQLAAVASPARALCIVAGAGTGKTRVLTLRVARRIRDGSAEADHTVVCTFTRKAAVELRERLRSYGVPVSLPAVAGGVPTPGVRAGTLHQLGLTLLRRHALDTGRPPPVATDLRWQTVAGLVEDAATAPAVDAEIGWAKARRLRPHTYAEAAQRARRVTAIPADQVADLFAQYQAALARRQAIDLDDVLIGAADLLRHDTGFAERMHWRYRHLSVDEFQDVNPAQFELIRALLGPRDDLCVVGDPNQAIYGWNGADPSLLTRLPLLFGEMAVLHLDENHRSTPQVVVAASAALGPTATPPPRSAAVDGPLSVVTAFEDDAAEAEAVADALLDRAERGVPWSDQAVLARTHDQLATVARALVRAGVPYRMAPPPESAHLAEGAAPGAGAQSAVEMATFHRAKGLEWDAVHVIGLEEGMVPIVYAEAPEAVEEERRLLYVALTRASRELHCSWARSRRMTSGRRMGRRPSPWLAAVERVSGASGGTTPRPGAAAMIARMRAELGR